MHCDEIGSEGESGMKVGCIRTGCCNGERNDKNVEHIWTKSDVAWPYEESDQICKAECCVSNFQNFTLKLWNNNTTVRHSTLHLNSSNILTRLIPEVIFHSQSQDKEQAWNHYDLMISTTGEYLNPINIYTAT